MTNIVDQTETLIPVTTAEDGSPAVLGRALWEWLEVKERYNDWFRRMSEYGFTEGQNYSTLFPVAGATRGFVPGGNRKDHLLTMDMAKEVAMIQRTEKGKQARLYFIECEKRAKAAAAPSELSRFDVLTTALRAVEEERAALAAE